MIATALPALPVLIFDGTCRFCTWSVRWVKRRLSMPASIVPFQNLPGGAFGLSEHELAAAAWWIDANGAAHGGHRAVAMTLQACRSPWPIVGRALLAPPLEWIAIPGYAVVSRVRFWLPGIAPAIRSRTERAQRVLPTGSQ